MQFIVIFQYITTFKYRIQLYTKREQKWSSTSEEHKERSGGKRYPDPFSPGINIYFTDRRFVICSLKHIQRKWKTYSMWPHHMWNCNISWCISTAKDLSIKQELPVKSGFQDIMKFLDKRSLVQVKLWFYFPVQYYIREDLLKGNFINKFSLTSKLTLMGDKSQNITI